jgi:hypothetical protein
MTPAGRSFSLGQFAWTSLRLRMLKWKGSPSPHQNQSLRTVSIRDDAVVDGDVTDAGDVSVAKLDGARGGTQAAVRDGDVLTGGGRPEPVHGVEDEGVVARFDRAVRDMEVAAAVGVDAVRPDALPEARADVNPVDDRPLAVHEMHRPRRRIDE